ncbi:hypothetical protein IMCC26256_111883 [Actinobacteria bacterium IMCC26256]|nr:hypothetical protein IMCC26256_111883 [Actinobacteria bacterium IMCC26256]
MANIDSGKIERIEYDLAEIYRGIRTRVTELILGASSESLERVAPATPEWSALGVLAHMVGSTADVIEGRLEGVASNEWTQTQVDLRSTSSPEQLLEEWGRFSPQVEPLIDSFPRRMQGMFIVDATTHEHDLRGALNAAGARDSDAVDYSFDQLSFGIGRQRGGAGALRIIHEAGERVVGEGEATAVLRTTRFEIIRAGVGRRSTTQIASWDWQGSAEPESVVIGMFAPPRSTDLVE